MPLTQLNGKKNKQKTKFAILLIFLRECRTYVDPPNIASACALMFSRSIPEKTMFITKLVYSCFDKACPRKV